MYKNLATATKMHNVSGLGSGGAARSFNMLMKSKYMDEIMGGKGQTYASGTPIITRYLRKSADYTLFIKMQIPNKNRKSAFFVYYTNKGIIKLDGLKNLGFRYLNN